LALPPHSPSDPEPSDTSVAREAADPLERYHGSSEAGKSRVCESVVPPHLGADPIKPFPFRSRRISPLPAKGRAIACAARLLLDELSANEIRLESIEVFLRSPTVVEGYWRDPEPARLSLEHCLLQSMHRGASLLLRGLQTRQYSS